MTREEAINEGIINRTLWVKESETHKWTMAGKRLAFCPMCGRRLEETCPKD